MFCLRRISTYSVFNLQDTNLKWKWLSGKFLQDDIFPFSKLAYPPEEHITCLQPLQNCYSNKSSHIDGECGVDWQEEGFHDFSISSTSCDSVKLVAVFCQNMDNSKGIEVDNERSDIKLAELSDSHKFSKLLYNNGCGKGNWLRFDDMCVMLLLCRKCLTDSIPTQICHDREGKLADKILKNAKITDGILHLNSSLVNVLLRYLSIGDFDLSPKVVVNGTTVCMIRNLPPDCLSNLTVILKKSHKYGTMTFTSFRADHHWQSQAGRHKLYFHPNYLICEKELETENNWDDHSINECATDYVVCKDGTCIHDSLVCDGITHCIDAADEQNCQEVCDKPNVNCLTECHMNDMCSCSVSFFQCFSGGCIPLGKLCDGNKECFDGSDEPPTCVYERPQNNKQVIFPLTVEDYVNNLIVKYNDNVLKKDALLKAMDGKTLSMVKFIDIPAIFCNEVGKESFGDDHLVSPQCADGSPTFREYFLLHRSCVYGTMCNRKPTCPNGRDLEGCETMYCTGRFKCLASYCLNLNYVCDGVCDCPQCEEEQFCEHLSCPGMILTQIEKSTQHCNHYDKSLKYALNRRQIIYRQNRMLIRDNYPVLAILENVKNVSDEIEDPILVIYCTISFSEIAAKDFEILHEMVSIQSLSLTFCNLRHLNVLIFSSMTQLIKLDLSNNLIEIIPNHFFKYMPVLKYLFLHNNYIMSLPPEMFKGIKSLLVLIIAFNNFTSLGVKLEGIVPSLKYLAGDFPRLCCLFKVSESCSPPFPALISCSDIFSSSVQISVAWLLGISISLLNIGCVILLTKQLFKSIAAGMHVLFLISLNLGLADTIAALYLLSLSFFNLYYAGNFGIEADHWRHSWRCYFLEFTFFASSEASLVFATFISVHFAVKIPAIVRKEHSKNKTILQIAAVWSIIILIGLARQGIVLNF